MIYIDLWLDPISLSKRFLLFLCKRHTSRESSKFFRNTYSLGESPTEFRLKLSTKDHNLKKKPQLHTWRELNFGFIIVDATDNKQDRIDEMASTSIALTEPEEPVEEVTWKDLVNTER